ncbi:hypothetical protein EROM_081740 [Encephalitozoon romaleae SJ-2008]|uniref:PH domain-containing protein n=1 Tax=Encephalitozoon romaleae (strain SJ-2008) TaxID=1178016 RepID=I7AFS0_ENCRO|nr:hypothetical protein EROM_081740 [Encephalitozoon romaleae SJ-2008]AFN83590.1 hypothetical protein EROM_081740 [Encephalitozoon romaleae SJ-2008]
MRDEYSYNEGVESRSTEMLLSILEHYDTNLIEEHIIDEYDRRRKDSGRENEDMNLNKPLNAKSPEKHDSFHEKVDESEPLESHMCDFINSYGISEDDSCPQEKNKLGSLSLDKDGNDFEASSTNLTGNSTVDLSGVRNLTDPMSLEKALEFERWSIKKEELVRNTETQRKMLEAFHSIPEVALKEGIFDDIKINKIYVESRIHIRKENGRKIKEKKGLIRGERDIEGRKETKTMMFDDYASGWELSSESASDVATREKAFKIIREAKKKATGRDLLCSGDMQLRKFVVDQEEKYLKIEEVIKLNDLKYKNLMGKIYKKGGNGKYQYNWFTLKKNFFTCYNGKGIKIGSDTFPSDKNYDFKDPEDETLFFKKKYTIDLLSAGIYLVKHPAYMGCIRWGSSSDEDLIDITEDTKIIRITPAKNYFLISLKKNLVKTEIKTSTLDFALRADGETYFYRSKDMDSFLGWLVAFAFRQGRIKCNIG